jgi:hypothetical protein
MWKNCWLPHKGVDLLINVFPFRFINMFAFFQAPLSDLVAHRAEGV